MAALYRQGCIAMLQGADSNNKGDSNGGPNGNDMVVLQHLEKALVISRLNEPHRGNAGESARVQWRRDKSTIGREWWKKGEG